MKRIVRILGVIIGTIAFNTFFWNESLGLNVVFYSALIFGILFYLYPNSFKTRNVIITVLGSLISAVLVVYNNSVTSKFAFICSFIVALGFIFEPGLRSVLTSWSYSFLNFFMALEKLITDFKKQHPSEKRKTAFSRWLKLFLLPVAILIVFILIFKAANPIFNDFTNEIGVKVTVFFQELFVDFTFLHFLFIIVGFLITVGAIYTSKLDFILHADLKRKLNITRESIKTKLNKRRNFRNLALKNEFRTGLILIVLINLLVLIINVIDINWIWLNFEIKENMYLQQLVHEGTYMLILSILLSMGLIMFYFRANLNYYPKNKLLVYGTYLWIFQNIIMVISVAIRNYHYISYYGLAYKRIGVIIFLLLVVIGLITIVLKIRKQKSGFYLIQNNSWAVYTMMIFISFFSWDTIIARYNIKHNYVNEIDSEFLLELSDKTLYILNENKELFDEETKYALNDRIMYFTQEYNESIFSWNYADDRSYNNLKNLKK